ncbi:MAG: GNAT family N-acetyltransferase [Acidobacteria bacterium]|nr:GNAT family N-acetyltransferase [Acidobacteriota bacterium]
MRIVAGGPDLEATRELFVEYERQIGVDLCFQNFAEELARLPGDYVAPGGTLLLAVEDGVPAGCVAMHRWDAESCEMKRLYVRPAFQGRGLGRVLVRRAVAWAVAQGYGRILLDTLPTMTTAQTLYERLGFVDTVPYRANPVAGARYMCLTLGRPAAT